MKNKMYNFSQWLIIAVVDIEFHPNPNPISSPTSLSHLATMPHIHLAMATKPPQLIKNVINIILL